jgi:hypothetical protein
MLTIASYLKNMNTGKDYEKQLTAPLGKELLQQDALWMTEIHEAYADGKLADGSFYVPDFKSVTYENMQFTHSGECFFLGFLGRSRRMLIRYFQEE